MKNKNKSTKFPVARIKKIMQKDEEVGKVAQATPIVISKALELFLGLLIEESSKVTMERGSKKVEAYHLKHAVETTEMLDFLKEIVEPVPDPSAGGTIDLNADTSTANGGAGGEVGPDGKKKRRSKKGATTTTATTTSGTTTTMTPAGPGMDGAEVVTGAPKKRVRKKNPPKVKESEEDTEMGAPQTQNASGSGAARGKKVTAKAKKAAAAAAAAAKEEEEDAEMYDREDDREPHPEHEPEPDAEEEEHTFRRKSPEDDDDDY